MLSWRSQHSFLSIGSEGSILSIGSIGSIASIGSIGSIMSIGSIVTARHQRHLLKFTSTPSAQETDNVEKYLEEDWAEIEKIFRQNSTKK